MLPVFKWRCPQDKTFQVSTAWSGFTNWVTHHKSGYGLPLIMLKETRKAPFLQEGLGNMNQYSQKQKKKHFPVNRTGRTRHHDCNAVLTFFYSA